MLLCAILKPEHSKAWECLLTPMLASDRQPGGSLLDDTRLLDSYSFPSCRIAANTFSCSATCSPSSSTSSSKSSNISCSSSRSGLPSFKRNHCVRAAIKAVTKPMTAAKIVPLSGLSFVLHLPILLLSNLPAD